MVTNNNIILNVQNLSLSFTSGKKETPTLKNVTFSLQKGQTLGIVGESGSGKSVTALSIMQLLPIPPAKITSGKISFNSSNLLNSSEKEMCQIRGNKIAMVFQEPMTSLNPVYTCGKQVAETLKIHKKISPRQARQETINWFNEVKLPDPVRIYKSYPHQLSGGQKQRVMIAMAICCNPEILIADEPTTALDVTIQKTILDLMLSLKEKYKMSIIFITHDLGVVAEIADSVLVMHKGEIVESGTARKIFNNPEHPYTRGLIACRPDTKTRLKRLPTVSDFLDNPKKFTDIHTVVSDLSVSKEEREQHLEKLYNLQPIMRIENLSTNFREKNFFKRRNNKIIKAVDNISFEVYPGETLGLVGESGCGKTTLGRSILRLIEPDEGKIYFNDINIRKLNYREIRKLRKKIQIIFQDPYSSLNPRITAGSAITEPMLVHNIGKNAAERKKKTIELLEKVGLDESHYYRYPHEFSGGQRQRICIARALISNPQFIICDESVSALDVSIQAQVLNLLNDLKKEYGFTYIFISHDLSVVRFMSDRIIVMRNGKIVETGDAEEIFSNPKDNYTRMLISAIPTGFQKILI